MADIQIDDGNGSLAAAVMKYGGDIRNMRPWMGKDGRSYITQNNRITGKPEPVLVRNNTALLRKDDWLVLDQAIIKAAKPRLKAVADLRNAGLQFTIPNGLGKTVLDTERQSDVNEATISMDGLRKSQNDRPVFDLQMLPLPIVHKDFSFSARQVMASRNGGSPLDTTMAELSARRVAEQVEGLLLGVLPSYAYGGGTIYGYTNFPDRLTKVMTAPTATGWVAETTVKEVLAMKLQSQTAFHYGPWVLYTSLEWDKYLDDDYKPTYNATTLRQRLKMIEDISDVRTLDYLPSGTMLLVQMTPDVARMIVGMEITTVQWETQGGMELNFKVMTINVPQLRSDFNHNTGIVHGSYTLANTAPAINSTQ